MSASKNFDHHLDDEQLWQWCAKDLNGREISEVGSHLENCAPCRRRAEAITRLINTMQVIHHAAQPTLAEQMQLVRTLEKRFISESISSVLVDASRFLVRWLAPAVAILAALFVLLRQETTTTNGGLLSLLPQTPESRLLLAATDDQLQEAMWDLALSNDESQR